MRRIWLLIAVSLGMALVACWDFERAYDDCLSSGRCPGGADGGDGGGGGGDGGDGGGGSDAGSDGGGDGGGGTDAGGCPPGSPTGSGLCLVQRYNLIYPGYGLYLASPSEAFVGGYEEAFSTVQGGRLQDGVTLLTNYAYLYDLDGTSGSDLWAAISQGYSGYSYIYHYDGSAWIDLAPVGFGAGACTGAWAEAAGTAFMACEAGVFRVTTSGAPQHVVDSGTTGLIFSGVWGIPGGQAWAVGGSSTTASIRRRQGTTWTAQDFAGTRLNAVHGRSDRDVWAVGNGAELMHLDDAGWRSVTATVLLGADLADVSVTSAGEAWITAYEKRVMVIAPDGGQRALIPPGLTDPQEAVLLQRVQALDTGDVWFTAYTDDGGTYAHGAVLHYRKQ